MSPLPPLLLGIVFGWSLERGGLTRWERVAGVFRFTDLTVVKFLGSALAVGTLAVEAARGLGFVAALPVPATRILADLLGGALFGIGMAVAGYCPATVVAGAATGRLDNLGSGMVGLAAGGLAAGALRPHVLPAIHAVGARGPMTFETLLGVRGWLLAVLLAEVALVGFYAIERNVVRPRRRYRRGGSDARTRVPRTA